MSKRTASKPLKMWIDGGCFNIRPYDITKRQMAKPSSQNEGNQVLTDNHYIINQRYDHKFVTEFRLPLHYYKSMFRIPGFNFKRLGQETDTYIDIPARGSSGPLKIIGRSEQNVIKAREVIHEIVGSIREKEPCIQFVGIPVNSDEIKHNFEQFKDEILNGPPIPGMDCSIFRSSSKLHLTLAVSSLLDEVEEHEAKLALQDCKMQIIDPILQEAVGQLKIKVVGIECMNNNLSAVNVLYAKAEMLHEGNDILQKTVNAVSTFFYNRGLIKQYKENVKLHVTLINTKKRNCDNGDTEQKACTGRSTRRYPKKIPFDARSIVEKYNNYYFGESIFNSLQIAYMSTTAEDGFYKTLSTITF